MAVNRRTLYLLRQLRIQVGVGADETTRALAGAWVRGWDEISSQLHTAVSDVVAEAVRLNRWPQSWELARIERLQVALVAAERVLVQLGTMAGVTVSDATGRIVAAAGDAEPHIIASQLPAAEQPAAALRFAARLLPSALDAIVARTQGLIVAQSRALTVEATDAMRRALVAGVALGSHPSMVAADMVGRVEGAFNGGLTRAMNVARTELLDAYRTTSAYAHTANSDVVIGWRWLSTLDSKTCPSCWSMNGTLYPTSAPGPWDHPSGRCARVPVTRSWADLGFHQQEPADTFPDAQARFAALPHADQLAIMGPGRLAASQSGQAFWTDLARRRDATGWRPSYVATPVRDLARVTT